MDKHVENYLPLGRSFFKHDLWSERREYSRAEAWLDLVQMARYSSGKTSQVMHGRRIEFKRGELTASIRFLRRRWGWGGAGRVHRFLKFLKDEKMITTDCSQGQTVITLTNFPKFNPSYGQIKAEAESNTSPAQIPAVTQKLPQPPNTPSQPPNDSQGKSQPPEPRKKTPASSQQFQQITKDLVDYWNDCNGTGFRSVTPRIPQVRQRLKTFSIDELKRAIKNRADTPWTKQNNQQANWDAVFKNDKQVEHWLERSPHPSGNRPAAGIQDTMSEEEARAHAEQSRRQFSPGLYTKVQINGQTRYLKPENR